MRTIIDRDYHVDAISGIGLEVANILRYHLINHERFCIWLKGEMGAGKTTLTREIFYGLGLPKNTPVLSPTFTYMNEYKIDGDWYQHGDFYRLMTSSASERRGQEGLVIDEFSLRDPKGIFLEWPANFSAAEDIFPPDFILELSKCEDLPEQRHISLVEC